MYDAPKRKHVKLQGWQKTNHDEKRSTKRRAETSKIGSIKFG